MIDKLNQLIRLCESAEKMAGDGCYPKGLARTLMMLANSLVVWNTDGEREDEPKWITTEGGKHIQIESETGAVLKGNIGQNKGDHRVSEKLRPQNDYDMTEVYGRQEFIRKNLEKLKPIYETEGGEGIDNELLKVKLNRNNSNLKPMDKEEVYDILGKVREETHASGWFRGADSGYKPRIIEGVTDTPEARNASLNLMYELYKGYCEYSGETAEKDFNRFLETPIKMYRGGKGQKHTEDDVFSSYSFDKDIAKKFAGESGRVYEAEIRPIDTFGSLNATGEYEIMVPRIIAPNGEQDSRDDGQDTKHGCGVIVVKDGKFLVGTRKDNGKVCSAGGHIQDDETDREGAIRETVEEFGIIPVRLTEVPCDMSGVVGNPTIFLCTEFRGEPECDEVEMTDPRYLELGEVLKEDLFLPYKYSLEHLVKNVLKADSNE